MYGTSHQIFNSSEWCLYRLSSKSTWSSTLNYWFLMCLSCHDFYLFDWKWIYILEGNGDHWFMFIGWFLNMELKILLAWLLRVYKISWNVSFCLSVYRLFYMPIVLLVFFSQSEWSLNMIFIKVHSIILLTASIAPFSYG